MNVEEDEAGRLAGFRARFGRGFDAGREISSKDKESASDATDGTALTAEEKVEQKTGMDQFQDDGFDENGFEEEDANLLDLISSYSQQGGAGSNKKGGGKGN